MRPHRITPAPLSLPLRLAFLAALLLACGSVERSPDGAAVGRPETPKGPALRAHLLSLDTLQIKGAHFSRVPGERRLYVTNVGKGKLWSYELGALRNPAASGRSNVPYRAILRSPESYFYVSPAVSVHLGGGRGVLAAGSESNLEKCCQLKLLSPEAGGTAREENLAVRPPPGGFGASHAADFDGDGRTDLIAIQNVPAYQRPNSGDDVSDAFVHLFLAGPRELVPKDVLELRNTEVWGSGPIDLGRDGRFELPFIVAGKEVSVIEFKGKGLSRRRLLALEPESSGMLSAFGDVDGDRDLDFLVTYKTKTNAFGLCCDVYLGDGRGGFEKRRRTLLSQPTHTGLDFQIFLGLVDLDGDGRDEILARHQNTLLAWAHRSNGRFEARPVRLEDRSGRFVSDLDPATCTVLDVYDFDGDGDLDLSCGERTEGSTSFEKGKSGPKQSELFLLENLSARGEGPRR